MNIQQLLYFISVAEHHNFMEAAKHLYIGQPALSRQIAELEKDIGVLLFSRNNRSVHLTPAGTVLLKYAKSIISLSNEALDNTRKAGRGLIGSLSIGYLYDKIKIPELIGRFRNKYPNTSVNLNRYNWGSLIEALQHEELNIGFMYSFGLERYPEMEYFNVFQDTLELVMSERHTLSGKSSIKLSDLAKEPFLHMSRNISPLSYEVTLNTCQKNGFTPDVIHESPQTDSLLMLIEAGVGITILPSYVSSQKSPSLRFIDIEGDETKIDMIAAWNKKNNNPAIRLFLEELMNWKVEADLKEVNLF
ncbi:LysR family transcriptional regulator [Paenibacillus periandrae]|uniref:LysR family transcriptional regulator n=1 Tax=Paenibacillus periandrae TaxID=1761741 RepID=UPI001F08EDEA|nr:LysR substrate-binding domain-containing protein [Paenibacillus periandrae]